MVVGEGGRSSGVLLYMHKLQQYNTVKHIGCKEAGTVGGSQISFVPNSIPSAFAVTKEEIDPPPTKA